MNPAFEEARKKLIEALEETCKAYEPFILSDKIEDWHKVVHPFNDAMQSHIHFQDGLIRQDRPPTTGWRPKLLEIEKELMPYKQSLHLSPERKQVQREDLLKILNDLLEKGNKITV